jgi:hypothetical protein
MCRSPRKSTFLKQSHSWRDVRCDQDFDQKEEAVLESIARRKSPELVMAANRWLDSAAQLSVLRGHFGLSNEAIADIHAKLVGAGLGRNRIWEFDKEERPALPGVWDVMVHYAAHTQFHIAEWALRRELIVRRANNSHQFDPTDKNLVLLVRELGDADRYYNELSRILKNLVRDPANEGERALDLGAIQFSQGQRHIIQARIASNSIDKQRHLRIALTLMSTVSKTLSHAVKTGVRIAEIMDVVLAVNAALNEYFVTWELDDLEKDPLAQVHAKSIAHKYAGPLFLKAAREIAVKQNDPRIAWNAASIAGLAHQDVSAADSLELSAKLDGHDGPFEEWDPAWLFEPVSSSTELTKAIEIIKKRGK